LREGSQNQIFNPGGNRGELGGRHNGGTVNLRKTNIRRIKTKGDYIREASREGKKGKVLDNPQEKSKGKVRTLCQKNKVHLQNR